jgi:hypothetical protein
MDQLVQVVGALLILIAYAAAQFGAMSQHSRVYLVLNLVGSIILAVLAFVESLWGFLLLEAFWAAVSLWGLAQVLRGRTPAGQH